jgi:acyl-CoA reductase-like NAD-dependent aldehyde dehydrogenase
MKIKSPFDQHEIGEVPDGNADDIDRAVTSAKLAMKTAPLTPWQRAEILSRCATLVSDRQDAFAHTIAEESAKPITTARTEASRAVSTLSAASVEARTLAGEMIPFAGSDVGAHKFGYTVRVPRGVVGAISPFNFPLNLVAHKVAPAIAAGCAVVLKPAEQTPFSAIALADALYESGLPREWLHVVTGDGAVVGDALVRHPDVSYISFTGSAEVGWTLPATAPNKPVSLELGNSTPVIIEGDADWRAAANGVASGGFSHAGQSCISVQRVYVHRSIATEFTELLVELVSQLNVGDPMDENTHVSALITQDDHARVKSWIDEAVRDGAQVACGNKSDGPLLFPTVLTNVTLDMKVCRDEVFGPVVAVQQYDTLDDAIALANGTRYGLQAAIFTANLDSAMLASQQLEFGGVLINETPTWRADIMPYGGVKDSGNTKEGPAYAVRSMTEERLLVINSPAL